MKNFLVIVGDYSMKVLQINVFHYRLGGSETVYFSTSDLLEKNGDKVSHFALKWEKNLPSPYSSFFAESKESRKGLLKKIYDIAGYFYNFDAARKIKKLIKQEKPDIAQIHLFWGQITPSVLPVLKKYNIPVVFTIHEYRMVCPAYTFRNGFGKVCEACNGKNFYHCFFKKCCKGSRFMSALMCAEQYFRNIFFNPSKYIDGLIYVSEFAKKKHEQFMPSLTLKKNITLYNLSDGLALSSKGSMPGEKYLLYFGRLSHEKGILTLIKAIADFPDYKLKIVGTGILEKSLKEFVSEKKLRNVEFVGYKTGTELKNYISQAYFIVVPSEWYENNPMTIIEGYSSAIPVIGADMGGIPEIIQNNRTGFLFKSGDVCDLKRCIAKAFSLNDVEYAAFSANALKFAKENFNQDLYYPRLMDFYKQVIAEKEKNKN